MEQSQTPTARSSRIPQVSIRAIEKIAFKSASIALIVLLGVLIYENAEASASWSNFNEAVRDFTATVGLIVAVVATSSLSKSDHRFIAASAARRAGYFRLNILKPLWLLFATYVSVVLAYWVVCQLNNLGGFPWWSYLPAALLWVLVVSPAMGALVAFAVRWRELLALVLSMLFYLAVLVAAHLANYYSFFPRLGVFWTDNYVYSLESHSVLRANELNISAVLIVLVISLIFSCLVCLAWLSSISEKWNQGKILLGTSVALLLSSGALMSFLGGTTSVLKVRQPVDNPICIVDPRGTLEFCDWPEANKVVESMKGNWEAYASDLQRLKLIQGGERISVEGVLENPEVEIEGGNMESTQVVFEDIVSTLLWDVVWQCPEGSFDHDPSLVESVESISRELAEKYGDGKIGYFSNSSQKDSDFVMDDSPIEDRVEYVLRCGR